MVEIMLWDRESLCLDPTYLTCSPQQKAKRLGDRPGTSAAARSKLSSFSTAIGCDGRWQVRSVPTGHALTRKLADGLGESASPIFFLLSIFLSLKSEASLGQTRQYLVPKTDKVSLG